MQSLYLCLPLSQSVSQLVRSPGKGDTVLTDAPFYAMCSAFNFLEPTNGTRARVNARTHAFMAAAQSDKQETASSSGEKRKTKSPVSNGMAKDIRT